MKTLPLLEQWLNSRVIDPEAKTAIEQLVTQKAEAELIDRFSQRLDFGTGGLRGIMGAGSNRINRYTVAQVTQGLSAYLLATYPQDLERGVVIAYDTRQHSQEFAQVAADVLTANGLTVYLFSQPVPTPELSFAVRHLQALAGIVITASHNPKEYNGYKVYDANGGQLVPAQVAQLRPYLTAVKDYEQIKFKGQPPLLKTLDLTDAFVQQVLRVAQPVAAAAKRDLKIVYTPLHGTGKIPVMAALQADGFTPQLEPAQAVADGAFPTVVSPNPEEKTALARGIALAQQTQADLVLGTDPDCDRVGIAVRDNNELVLLSGNMVGALLIDYLCQRLPLNQLMRPAIVKTIVTNDLGAKIAARHGLTVFSTLTGFKYIGEKMTQFATAAAGSPQAYTFILGYEESYGYLVGQHARDKDAVVAALLISEMAATYKAQGLTLVQRLQQLYQEYGYFVDSLASYTCRGADGQAKIQQIMTTLRTGLRDGNLLGNARQGLDYAQGLPAEPGFGHLPAENVLKFIYDDGTWLAVRPSGTEPKIKFYYSACGADAAQAQAKLQQLKQYVQAALPLEG